MANVKVNELKNVFMAIDEARQNILRCFPYNKMTILFCKELKIYLKEQFSSDIEFDRCEKFGFINGWYKGIKFEINVLNGIVLTIEDKDYSSIIEDFKPIFNDIVGSDSICSYDYCYQLQVECPTIEWSLHPEERLAALTNTPDSIFGSYKKDFNDYYNASIINSLGDDLLTQQGYDILFQYEKDNEKYRFHKISLIQSLRHDINTSDIYNWITRCQTNNEMNKQFIK